MKKKLIDTSSKGDDRNLAEHSDGERYWYSINDILVLLIGIREECLTYYNKPVPLSPGEEYAALRESDQRVFIADPHYSENFDNYLSNDINKILGEEDIKSNVWEHMPNQIIIPLLSGLHWRVIRIEIEYEQKSISILWDDPYGGDAFPEQLRNEFLISIRINVNKLFTKKISNEMSSLTDVLITEVIKTIDQQHKGENSWDCGPIAVSNIKDYAKHFFIKNNHFSQYSIPEFTNIMDYELSMVNARAKHLLQYRILSAQPIGYQIENACESSVDLISASIKEFNKHQRAEISNSALPILNKLFIEDQHIKIEKLSQALSNQNKDASSYIDDIHPTLSMNLHILLTIPKALDLLSFCSYLSAYGIPEQLFDNSFITLVEKNKIIAMLEEYSLISVKIENEIKMIYVDKLLQEEVRDKTYKNRLQVLQQAMELVHNQMADCSMIYDSKEILTKNRPMLPHAISLLKHYNAMLVEISEDKSIKDLIALFACKLYSDCGNLYYICREFDQALAQYEMTLHIAKAAHTAEHQSVATAINGIGNVYSAMGNFQKAMLEYEESLRITRVIYGDEHPLVAASLNNIGRVYQAIGKDQDALICYKQSLKIVKLAYGECHSSVTINLNAIGSIYQALGKNQDALICYKQALSIIKLIYDEKHPLVVGSLSLIGTLYLVLGKAQDALIKYEEVLQITKSTYGNQHPSVAIILNLIGQVYQAIERNHEALIYYKEALEIFELFYGNEHSDVVWTIYNIGNVYKELKNYENSLLSYEQALKIIKIIYDEDHPFIPMVLNSMADVYQILEERQGALVECEEIQVKKVVLEDIHETAQINNMVNPYNIPLYHPEQESAAYKNPETSLNYIKNKYLTKFRLGKRDLSEPLLGDNKLSSHQDKSSHCTIFCITGMNYHNLFLNMEELLYEAGRIGGISAVSNLIKLGEDIEVAEVAIEAIKQYGVKHVLNILLGKPIINTNQLNMVAETIKIVDSLVIDGQKNVAYNNFIILQDFISSFFGNLDISWRYKKILYWQEINYFSKILQNNNIDRSIDVLRDYSDFRKSVLLKIHPDKGGNNDDFVFVKALQEKFSANLDSNIKTLLDDKIQTISFMIYKASIGFKILDAMVDTVRLAYEPTIDHTKKLTLDSAHIYSMYSGVNGYSLGISTADILYQTYQGEYLQALKQAATSMSYMLLPSIIGYLGVPYLGFTYGAGMMVYTGYSSITNAYSLYQGYGSVEFHLRSATTYKDLTQVLANSPLQKIYDFMVISKEYSVKVNKINLNIEKTFIKTQLEAKGEFGHKLYDYIYAPSLEEKYDLLNKVMEGSLTKEQAESLKTKHIKITSENQVYGHCMEIKNIENGVDKANEANQEYYYCYNDGQQILEYIVIGENRDIEIISRL